MTLTSHSDYRSPPRLPGDSVVQSTRNVNTPNHSPCKYPQQKTHQKISLDAGTDRGVAAKPIPPKISDFCFSVRAFFSHMSCLPKHPDRGRPRNGTVIVFPAERLNHLTSRKLKFVERRKRHYTAVKRVFGNQRRSGPVMEDYRVPR